MSEKQEMTPEMHCYLKGYLEAITDFGIWNNGQQTIGCLSRPVKEVWEAKLIEKGFNLKDWGFYE